MPLKRILSQRNISVYRKIFKDVIDIQLNFKLVNIGTLQKLTYFDIK